MPPSTSFNEAITGHNVIAGSSFDHGATMNINFGSVPQDKPAGPRKPFHAIPFAPDPDFVNRPDILAWVHDKCASGVRAALVGLGGVGKSQLAIQHAYRAYDATPQSFVFWVHASTRARFEEAYQGIADRLQLPGRQDPKVDVLRLVYNWLCDEANGRWLIVVDNADDSEVFYSKPTEQDGRSTTPARLAAYLPNSRSGSILITSRNKEAAIRLAGGYKNVQEVPAMNEDQAVQLLRSKLQDTASEDGAEDLVRALDCIPLAVTQAAAYINQRARMTIRRYLEEFLRSDKKRESLLRWDADGLWRDESASSAVVTTWQLSFERIREARLSAANLLSLMSFFNAQGISESMLQRYYRAKTGLADDEDADSALERNFGALQLDDEDVDSAFERDFDTLRAYSLVTSTAEEDMCEMHALVQFRTHLWLSSRGEAQKWKEKFIQLLSREFPHADFENWARCQQLLPHVESLHVRSWDESGLSGERIVNDWAFVLMEAAQYMRTALGKYSEAEKLHRRVLEEEERELGVQHPDTLVSVNNLASVLCEQGNYNEAEKLHRRVLEERERALGVQHPDTLTSVSNLALVLYNQRKYNEAEKLSWRALEGEEKELGVKHPSTLTIVQNLSLVLHAQGKYDNAEKLSRRALEGYEKELGRQHQETLICVDNLATILQNQGKYNEAEKLNWRALKGLEEQLGMQHPDTLISVEGLAHLLYKTKRQTEAVELYQRAYNGFTQALGPQHPTTIACREVFSALQQDLKYTQLAEN